MSGSMLHATDAQHINLGSSWVAMDSIVYESDGVHEFRSPNGLDLDTSSDEDSPTNSSIGLAANSRDIYGRGYREPLGSEPPGGTGYHMQTGMMGSRRNVDPAEDSMPQNDQGSSRNYGRPQPMPQTNGRRDGLDDENDSRSSQEGDAGYRARVQMAYTIGDMSELEKVLIETRNIPELGHIRKVTKKALKKLLAQRVLDEPLAFGVPAADSQAVSLYAAQTAGPGVMKTSSQESGIGIARKNDNTFVMDLLPGVVGWVIGRAGTRIKEIQAQSGCKMWVDQDVPDDQPRKLYFHGNKANIEGAIQLVNDLLQSAPILAGKHGQVSKLTSHIMDCPPDLVGLLIGKKGWTIKKIQQESGAQISINQSVREGLPRKIIISGTEDAVRAAIELIEEVLKNKQDPIPTRYVGVDEATRAVSLPTTISAAGLSNARGVTGGRVVSSTSRAVYPEGSHPGLYQQSMVPELTGRPNAAPPGFALSMNGQVNAIHSMPRPQTRSVSPQMPPGPHPSYMGQQAHQGHAVLNGYTDGGSLHPAHQPPVNVQHAYAQHAMSAQHANLWHQHAMNNLAHMQPPQPQIYQHGGYQQQLPQTAASYSSQPQLMHQLPASHNSHDSLAGQVYPSSMQMSMPVASLEQSMSALTISTEVSSDSMLNVASVIAQSGATNSPSVTNEEWRPMSAAAASPLWQPSSMTPSDQSAATSSDAVPGLGGNPTLPSSSPSFSQFEVHQTTLQNAASTFDLSLALGNSRDLSVGASIFSAPATKPGSDNQSTNENTLGGSAYLQSFDPAASFGIAGQPSDVSTGGVQNTHSGWDAGVGQFF